MEELRDIKDIVEVHDHSLEMLLALILTALLLLGISIYLYRNRRKRRRKPTEREIAYNRLQSIDYSNPKEIAYTFTLNGARFATEETQAKFQELEKKLSRYKYKRDVPDMDNHLIQQVQEFIKGVKL